MEQYVNTDRELWRADLQDPLDPSNAYADSVFVTADDEIGIQSGGHVAVKIAASMGQCGSWSSRNS